jgi:hypothetical protein
VVQWTVIYHHIREVPVKKFAIQAGRVSKMVFTSQTHPLLLYLVYLTLNMLTTTIVAPPSNASKWQMGFNSAFKGLMYIKYTNKRCA